ncbi:MAG: GntR family transcriptional regulator [Paracoccaceae bacterium]
MMLLNRSLGAQKKRAEKVRDAVVDHIRDHGLKAGDRIPTEAALCAAFGVSRPLVREALRLLEQERLVLTKHGLGRYVTAAAGLNIARPITAFESISQMLKALGHKATTRVLSMRTTQAASDPHSATALELPPEAEILILERFREVDGQVLVYSIDVLPLALIGAVPEGSEVEGSVNELLAAAGHRPVISRANVAATFMPEGVLPGQAQVEPWLLVTETCLSEAGTPVLSARDYHRGSQISFNFSRQ